MCLQSVLSVRLCGTQDIMFVFRGDLPWGTATRLTWSSSLCICRLPFATDAYFVLFHAKRCTSCKDGYATKKFIANILPMNQMCQLTTRYVPLTTRGIDTFSLKFPSVTHTK